MKVSNIFFINLPKENKQLTKHLIYGVIEQIITAKIEIFLAMSGKLSLFQFGVVH
jgi:hypothetical protein